MGQNGPTWAKMGQKWAKMGKNGQKWAKNGQTYAYVQQPLDKPSRAKNGPKRAKMGQNGPKRAKNDPKMTQKWAKMGQKWDKWAKMGKPMPMSSNHLTSLLGAPNSCFGPKNTQNGYFDPRHVHLAKATRRPGKCLEMCQYLHFCPTSVTEPRHKLYAPSKHLVCMPATPNRSPTFNNTQNHPKTAAAGCCDLYPDPTLLLLTIFFLRIILTSSILTFSLRKKKFESGPGPEFSRPSISERSEKKVGSSSSSSPCQGYNNNYSHNNNNNKRSPL